VRVANNTAVSMVKGIVVCEEKFVPTEQTPYVANPNPLISDNKKEL
jgi:hypothetical protein